MNIIEYNMIFIIICYIFNPRKTSTHSKLLGIVSEAKSAQNWEIDSDINMLPVELGAPGPHKIVTWRHVQPLSSLDHGHV